MYQTANLILGILGAAACAIGALRAGLLVRFLRRRVAELTPIEFLERDLRSRGVLPAPGRAA